MSGIKELQEEYYKYIFLIRWKAEEVQSYIKHIGQSENEISDWTIGKMQAGMQCILALEKKKVALLKTDLGQVCMRKQEEWKKLQLIEKDVDSCVICRAFRRGFHPIFYLADEVYFWIVEFGELSIDPQPELFRKRMKTLSVKHREALGRVQEYGHSCKFTKALLNALNNY